MKHRIILKGCLLAVFILFTACQKSEETEQAKIPVNVLTVKMGEVKKSLSFNGDIQAKQEVKVFSKIPDKIDAFYADEGDYVREGAVVAKIAATAVEQAVKQAEAGMSAAAAQQRSMQAEYERAVRLRQEDAMSQQQFDLVSTQYEAANAQLEQAQAMLTTAGSQLKDAYISAPIAGIIGKRYYETGDMANPGMPVFTVVQMDQVEIHFNAPEREMAALARGQAAYIRVAGFQDRLFEGTLTKISPVLDPMTRMAEVKAQIDNPDHLLKPGMYAEVEITVGLIENTIVIPRYAVLENSSLVKIDGKDTVVRNYLVYVVEDSLATQRQLDVNYVNHQVIAVNSGISEGEKLVVSGQNNLRDGLSVLIVDWEESL